MIARHTLPSGAWIEIGTIGQVTERQRRPVRLVFAKITQHGQQLLQLAARSDDGGTVLQQLSADDQEVLYQVNDVVASVLIQRASWLDEGERVTADSLLDLPAADYDRIVELMGPLVGPLIAGVDFDPSPDPASPTPPSSD